VSGCGSLEAVLDTGTQRTAAWVQVRVGGRPAHAAAWRWYHTPACAAAALGLEAGQAVRTQLTGEITAALELLADAGMDTWKVLGRRRGLESARRIVSLDRPGASVARCYLCGCTGSDPCAGGCWWVPDPQMHMREVCSACAPPGPCRTAGCGTAADNVDESDPELWGWIRVQVAGSGHEPVWVCSLLCATEVMGRAGDELAAAGHAPAAGHDLDDVAAGAHRPRPPHEDESLPPQLREALRIMARRGPVVELTAGTAAPSGGAAS
jgi:hypothetical protein